MTSQFRSKKNGDALWTAAGRTSTTLLKRRSFLFRWVVEPGSYILDCICVYLQALHSADASFKLLSMPLTLSLFWEALAPPTQLGKNNPFSRFFKVSGYITTSSAPHPLCRKTLWDLAFLAYYVIFFAFFRTSLALRVSRPAARYFRVRRHKTDRFCEQLYSIIYFLVFGAWGCVSFQLLYDWDAY